MKLNDLTGKRFGRLTVEKRVDEDYSGGTRWLCKCDCGVEKVVLGSNLIRGRIKSCGCYRRYASRNRQYKPIYPGEKFGRLSVVCLEDRRGQDLLYKCLCDCGRLKTVFGSNLRSGKTTSCGCMGAYSYHKEKTVRKDNMTGFRGVYYRKDRNKYRASIKIDKKRYDLSTWDTAEQAYKMRLLAEEKILKPWLQAYEDQKETISDDDIKSGLEKLIAYQKGLILTSDQ